jgi:glutamate-5-semialdehyde dehydrogenase
LDNATLSLQTGNAVIRRGRQRDTGSNLALVAVIQAALRRWLAPGRRAVIPRIRRALVFELLRLDKYVDMIIPRGAPGCNGSAASRHDSRHHRRDRHLHL